MLSALRLFLLSAFVTCSLRADTEPAAEVPPPLPAHYARAEVDTVKTSIYVGNVKLFTTTFERDGAHYRAEYEAKVFPFFFYNEAGTIAIALSDEDLQRLAAGERVQFEGEALTHDGEPRLVTGHADATDARSGTIKVRVWVSKNIELIFNTTYRFTG